VSRFEDERFAAILPDRRTHRPFRGDAPGTVRLVAEQGAEHCVVVEARQTEPVDRPVAADERGRAAIADQRVVFD
jgi:hypothetical protein